ncbi:MAG: DEAD/DEAH box helicase [Candidatus Bathyarchaeota archaeon]
MRIEELDIPDEQKNILLKLGYRELYPPQEEAIRKGVLEGKCFILASPTASGKTLIAEFCALKHVLEKNGKVIYLVPLRALASEKYDDFLKYAKIKKSNGQNVQVAISTGDYDTSDPQLAKYDIIIATNEKVDSLLRHRAEWLKEVTLVVADEIHLLRDVDRGSTLEFTLTALKRFNPSLQILALSATIGNVEEIAEWLKADYVVMDWRPVPLREGVVCGDEALFKDGAARKIELVHQNSTISLAYDVAKNGGQVLIFVDTRKNTVGIAQKLSPLIRKLLSKGELKSLKLVSEQILMVEEKTSLSDNLAKLIQDGVAFHHAGVHASHRKIVEDNFRKGLIKVIVATPTLAAGVNLPARSVIVNNYLRYELGYGRIEIPVLEYKQMAGRAGRPKYDKFGEAFLVASTLDECDYLMKYYVCAKPEKVWSKLGIERILRSFVLASITSGFAKKEEEVYGFFSETFYAYQYGEKIIQKPLASALKFLIENEMVKFKDGGWLKATTFGKRVSELYIDPESAVILKLGLEKCKIISEVGLLHLISHTPDMTPKLYPSRKEEERLIAFFEEYADNLLIDLPNMQKNNVDFEVFLGELKCTEVLLSWISEKRENDILESYGVEPGDLYRLVEVAEWLLYSTYELAKLLGFKDFLPKISELRLRIKHGVKPELLPLVSIPGIGRIRARMLYNSGYRSLENLKHASVTELTRVPGIGQKLALKIKSEVGGTIKRKELEDKIPIQQSLLEER